VSDGNQSLLHVGAEDVDDTGNEVINQMDQFTRDLQGSYVAEGAGILVLVY